MTHFLTAEEINAKYVVGPIRLARFSKMGALPTRCGPDGEPVYSEEFVAAIFRRRGQALLKDTSAGMGEVGKTTLGSHQRRTRVRGIKVA